MGSGTVLLRKGSLGDVVLLGSVTGQVRAPVTVVCDPRWAGVARRLVGVSEVLPWGETLPRGRVVDLQGGLRGFRAAPFAHRIDKRSLRRRLRLWTGRGRQRPSVVELYAEACAVRPSPAPWIDVRREARDALALVPGAAWGPKRWRRGRLAEVGKRWPGPVVVLGGPRERELVADVAGRIPGAEALSELGFERTIEVLGRTRVAVAPDSGLMHLAAACGAKVVGLFGPTHPEDGFWVHDGEVVQRSDLSCRPCTLHRIERCAYGHGRCMDLEVDQVMEAVQRCGG